MSCRSDYPRIRTGWMSPDYLDEFVNMPNAQYIIARIDRKGYGEWRAVLVVFDPERHLTEWEALLNDDAEFFSFHATIDAARHLGRHKSLLLYRCLIGLCSRKVEAQVAEWHNTKRSELFN